MKEEQKPQPNIQEQTVRQELFAKIDAITVKLSESANAQIGSISRAIYREPESRISSDILKLNNLISERYPSFLAENALSNERPDKILVVAEKHQYENVIWHDVQIIFRYYSQNRASSDIRIGIVPKNKSVLTYEFNFEEYETGYEGKKKKSLCPTPDQLQNIHDVLNQVTPENLLPGITF